MWRAIRKQTIPRRKYELSQQLYLLIHMKKRMLRLPQRERRPSRKRRQQKGRPKSSFRRKSRTLQKHTVRESGSTLIWLQRSERQKTTAHRPARPSRKRRKAQNLGTSAPGRGTR